MQTFCDVLRVCICACVLSSNVTSGVNRACVRRLKKTWVEVGEEANTVLKEMEDLMSHRFLFSLSLLSLSLLFLFSFISLSLPLLSRS